MEGNKGKLTLRGRRAFLEKKVCLCSRASALLLQLFSYGSSRDSGVDVNIALVSGKGNQGNEELSISPDEATQRN